MNITEHIAIACDGYSYVIGVLSVCSEVYYNIFTCL